MRFWSLAVGALLVAGCREQAEPAVPPVTSAIPPPLPPPEATPKEGVSGEVTAPPNATGKGRLALTWLDAHEGASFAKGDVTLTIIKHMIDHMTVSPDDIDLAITPHIPYAIPTAPNDAIPIAIFDLEHTFWETFEGRGKGLVGAGMIGGGPISIAANPPRAPRPEACDGERYKLLVVEDAALGKRRFCAYLPASYKTETKRRYPVILMFPGFGSSDLSYLTGKQHAGERLEGISKDLGREAIVVGVDTSTALGSTYLEDSPATGPWNTFLAKTALPKIDKELRTLPGRNAHAVMGQSTGGYNALSYGMRHSDLFGAIGASSPDAPDIEKWMFDEGTRHPRTWLKNWELIEAAVGGAGQFTSWAAAWSPDKNAPRGFLYPINPKTRDVDESVLTEWVAQSPHGLIRNPDFLARTKKNLSGHVMIIVGKKDDFGLFEPAQSFAEELETAGVKTAFVATEQGHAGHLERFDQIFRWMLPLLDKAQ